MSYDIIMTSQDKSLARGLYRNTNENNRIPFSVNDFKDFNYHQLSRYKDGKSIGGFFRLLQEYGYVSKVGDIRAAHAAAKGRKVGLWVWTGKARKSLKRASFGR